MRGIVFLAAAIFAFAALACSPPSARNCWMEQREDGTAVVACPDGSEVVLADGQDGASPLIVNEPLAPGGEDCPAGGFAVHIGYDADGDGTLTPDETLDTATVCNGADGSGPVLIGVLEGSYIIRNSLDAARLGGVTDITGDLRVDGYGLIDVYLPALVSIGGDLAVEHQDTLTTFSLPELQSVGGYVSFDMNGLLQSIAFASLSRIGWNLNVVRNSSLQALSVPSLDTLENEGGIIIESNGALRDIEGTIAP